MDEWYVFEYDGTSGERCDVGVTLNLREMREFDELSRARVQALIEQGGVLYDGKEVPRAQKNLRPGMQVTVNLTLLRALLSPPAPDHIEPIDMPLEFHYVDDHIVVVEKPAGISVHPSATEQEPTLAAALVHHFRKLSDSGGADRPGIVHRLDKETSGLLVVARDNTTHVALSRQFADRLVEKEYAALCVDAPDPIAGAIDLPIERHPRQRQKMWSGGRGRAAQTEYRIRERWEPFALLDVAIHTGRTHQIRVHLLSVGSAILGDDKYGAGRNGSLRKFLQDGGGSAQGKWRKAFASPEKRSTLLSVLAEYPGIFLHAQRLAFTHPASDKQMRFKTALPSVWQQVQELCATSDE